MLGLLDITIYHWFDTDYFYGVEQADVKADRAVLEDAYSARQVALRWVTEGNAREVDQSYPGIAEDDFIRFPPFWSPQSHLSQNAH
ncbi:hypothetical protein SCP_0214410 [Sparassis crispa]|uniref:Uncharacterized protein n=1 Tax=Sparassis crispa TaxID=139825 RepID=A0A401GDL9_9APHY|nr:hypothetical protein SCP_0214410 [Sparassis crispa]GBE80231.1 hypothetical protein SCP_0214410 [Sparassis crispa]